MADSLIWITEQDVVSLVTLDDAIPALERGLRALGRQEAFNVPKALGGYGDGSSMHSLGSGAPALGYVGYKNWVHTKRGATALYTMFNAADGSIAAVIEAAALGQLRTAAMTGVGTRWLADAAADDMALIGTGTQSITQVAAINAVRPLARVRVWSPTPEKRRAFTEQLRRQFPFAVAESPTLEAATKDASIVTLVTRAKDPFLHAGMLARGAHLNAVGAILPANAEFHQDVFERVDLIAVDDVTSVRRASRELMERFGSDDAGWSKVRPIGEIIAENAQRPAGCDVTLFKAMGMGLSDLSVAVMALERARAQGIGRAINHPIRAVPRWNPATAPAQQEATHE
jgi:ornithine cyclodeaminase/alanine dehydrogenase-like protein (mu-crystallin family)